MCTGSGSGLWRSDCSTPMTTSIVARSPVKRERALGEVGHLARHERRRMAARAELGHRLGHAVVDAHQLVVVRQLVLAIGGRHREREGVVVA